MQRNCSMNNFERLNSNEEFHLFKLTWLTIISKKGLDTLIANSLILWHGFRSLLPSSLRGELARESEMFLHVQWKFSCL